MRPRVLLHVAAVALLVVGAGCTGLTLDDDATAPTTEPAPTRPTTADRSTTASPTDGGETTTASTRTPTGEQSLPVDEDAVFQRVERLLDVDATQPTVRVVSPGDPARERSPKLFSLFGATDDGNPRTCMPNVAASANGSVVSISTEGLDAAEVELLLVHEYVHVVQEQSGQIAVQTEMRNTLTNTVRGTTTSRAIVEGAAVYTTQVYAQQHDRRWGDLRPMELRQCLYRNSPKGVSEIYGMYYFGGRYVQQRLDTPANLSTVYQQPPRTAEALVHDLERDNEPPAALTVTVDASDAWTVDSRGPRGELFVRSLLSSELDASRAATAAAGWGEDEAVLFTDGGTTISAAAWVLRFDSQADADEFEAAASDLDATETDQYPAVRVERIGPETVVLLGGEERFVTNTTVSGSNANVTVVRPAA